MTIQKIGVLGCGLMGSGIAQAAAKAGMKTIVREVDQALLDKGAARIRDSVNAAVAKGKMPAPEAEALFANLSYTINLGDLKDCDLVIEAIVENMAEKKKVFSELDGLLKPDAMIASNTSSLSITEMAAVTRRRDRVFGLHFFNPVPIMKLVEIVRGYSTNDTTIAAAREFVTRLGKTPILAKDTPGFVVNLLLIPYLLGAIRALESGLATREDIDTGMELGCGHPMGPLKLLDFVGLDTTYYISEIMFEEFKEPVYAAPPLLKRMVLAGLHGRKSGRGFYDWTANPPK